MKRPIPILILGILFMATGLTGLVYHLHGDPLNRETLVVSLVRLLAVIGGIFLLLGKNWARWLVVAWMGFHVAISALHSWWQVAAHAVLLVVISYFLFTRPDSDYFRQAPSD
ncbi:MAG TPA: hypothetical protein VMT32_19470 [Bryobacteraceae bacterium]|nr:hypothetical protein [Bryobacteraceae bacterium]